MFICCCRLLHHITCQCTSLHIWILSSQVQRSVSSKTRERTGYIPLVYLVGMDELIKRVFFSKVTCHSETAKSVCSWWQSFTFCWIRRLPWRNFNWSALTQNKAKTLLYPRDKSKKKGDTGVQSIWFLRFCLRWNLGHADAYDLHLYMLNWVGTHGWSCIFRHMEGTVRNLQKQNLALWHPVLATLELWTRKRKATKKFALQQDFTTSFDFFFLWSGYFGKVNQKNVVKYRKRWEFTLQFKRI